MGTNFSEILIKMQNFSFTKMHMKITPAKWRPFCPGGGGLTRVIICNCFTMMQLLTHARVTLLIWIISVSRRVPWMGVLEVTWITLTGPIWGVPDNKVHGANMGPIWGRQDSGGPHVGPMNFIIWGSVAVMTFKPNANYPKRMGRAPGFQLPGHPPTTMV